MKNAVFVLMFLSLSTLAAAQQVPTDDPVASAPIHIGAVGLDPRFGLTNAGWDTNVFNEVVGPKKDVTFTVTPGTRMWLRTGKGLLSVDGNLELVYFNTYSSERSVNSDAKGQFELRFNRFRPYVSAATINSRQRPGYEIDARVRHYETDFHFGSDFRVASKGTVRIDLRRLDYIFGTAEVFNGRPLFQELNRNLKSADLGWRQRLTALTTWITRISRESERFDFDKIRNSDSLRISSGFELGRLALIRGSGFVGYRKLTPADGGILREFSGITADVNVSYTAPTQTRLGAVVTRDVQYSYEPRTPYYLQTGWTGTLTQRLVGRWDVQVSGGRDRLAYQTVAANPLAGHTDFVDRFGGGIGYAAGDQVRMSFDVHSFHRSSDLAGRAYGGIRAGVSVTYGF